MCAAYWLAYLTEILRSRVRIQLLLMVFFSVVPSATCPWLVNRQLFSCMVTVSGDFDYVIITGGLLERIALVKLDSPDAIEL